MSEQLQPITRMLMAMDFETLASVHDEHEFVRYHCDIREIIQIVRIMMVFKNHDKYGGLMLIMMITEVQLLDQ